MSGECEPKYVYLVMQERNDYGPVLSVHSNEEDAELEACRLRSYFSEYYRSGFPDPWIERHQVDEREQEEIIQYAVLMSPYGTPELHQRKKMDTPVVYKTEVHRWGWFGHNSAALWVEAISDKSYDAARKLALERLEELKEEAG